MNAGIYLSTASGMVALLSQSNLYGNTEVSRGMWLVTWLLTESQKKSPSCSSVSPIQTLKGNILWDCHSNNVLYALTSGRHY